MMNLRVVGDQIGVEVSGIDVKTMIQPFARYEHKWRVGDIVIWDNRCSYHKAAADYPPEQDRIHWRVSIRDWREAA